jgi:hypothetical protein
MPPGQVVTSPQDVPPEIVQRADQELQAATQDMLKQEIGNAVNQEVARSANDLDAAGDFRDIMNAVWNEDAGIPDYRNRLAEVVGWDDAERTPDSVLALVQPTLQLAQIDQGIGALMQEELAEVGDAGGGITELATQGAVVDGMAAETGALVNAVGNMAQGPRPMAPQEGIMDPMLMQAMMQGAGSMAPQEGMVDHMVTGMRNGGMAYAQPLDADLVQQRNAFREMREKEKALWNQEEEPRIPGRRGVRPTESPYLEKLPPFQEPLEKPGVSPTESPYLEKLPPFQEPLEKPGVSPTEYPNAIDTVKSLVQGFAAQGVPNPVKEGINAAIGFYGIPVDVVNYALGRLGIHFGNPVRPTSERFQEGISRRNSNLGRIVGRDFGDDRISNADAEAYSNLGRIGGLNLAANIENSPIGGSESVSPYLEAARRMTAAKKALFEKGSVGRLRGFNTRGEEPQFRL